MNATKFNTVFLDSLAPSEPEVTLPLSNILLSTIYTLIYVMRIYFLPNFFNLKKLKKW